MILGNNRVNDKWNDIFRKFKKHFPYDRDYMFDMRVSKFPTLWHTRANVVIHVKNYKL
jgi:hypothetical protein